MGGCAVASFNNITCSSAGPANRISTTLVCGAVMLFMMAAVGKAGALGAREAVKVFLASWVAYVVWLRG